MSWRKDSDLGMHRYITRRDFGSGAVAAVGGASAALGWLSLFFAPRPIVPSSLTAVKDASFRTAASIERCLREYHPHCNRQS